MKIKIPIIHRRVIIFLTLAIDLTLQSTNMSLAQQMDTTVVVTKPEGWSLTSLPVAISDSTQNIFPNAVVAFEFVSEFGYQPLNSLRSEIGFWLNLSEMSTDTISGTPIEEFSVCLPEGWSLLGGLTGENAVVTASQPSTILALFRFTQELGYELTQNIPFAEAIWINLDTTGVVTVSPSSNLLSIENDLEITTLEAQIISTGEDLGSSWIKVSSNVIGVDGSVAGIIPYSPSPPQYTTQIRLFMGAAIPIFLYKDIRFVAGTETLTWILEVDPNGNAGLERTSVLSWDPADLMAISDRPWVLREGMDGAGPIEVADMRTTTSYPVTGTGDKFFTITVDMVMPPVGVTSQEDNKLPKEFTLLQNYPNPFNPATTIRYGLPKKERVTLKVYNILGAEVVTLVDNELKTAGYHSAIWDSRNNSNRQVASGLYFLQMRAGKFEQTRKMLLIE